MATVIFYKNKHYYPHFTETLERVLTMNNVTPVGLNSRSGTLHLSGSMDDFLSVNYMSYQRGERIVWAWVDKFEYVTESSFNVSYTVDPWRTFRNRIDMGVQYIKRTPNETFLPDPLLGSSKHNHDVALYPHTIGSRTTRTLVVQLRAKEIEGGGTDTGGESDGQPLPHTPVQPAPYSFFMFNYNIASWTSAEPVAKLMRSIMYGAKPKFLVTMYSIPYIDISSLPQRAMNIGDTVIDGFREFMIGDTNVLTNKVTITIPTPYRELQRIPHSVQIVIPEAGVMTIPDVFLERPNLEIRQDIDLYSGGSNYLLISDGLYTGYSLRGSSVSSIPIISDPLDTYISQNQNTLNASMLMDVASIGLGIGAMATGVGSISGIGAIGSGISNIFNRHTAQKDIANQFTNPPAFLGTALAQNFNGQIWVIVSKHTADNTELVHSAFGYPMEKISRLIFPTKGYIQTEGCVVTTTDGTVPRWAIDEINGMFNNGILVH